MIKIFLFFFAWRKRKKKSCKKTYLRVFFRDARSRKKPFCEATARNFSCVREAKKIKRKKRYRTNKSLNLAFG
ncbi:hypothetical protein BGS43_05055 [Campylobacter sp. 110]|nr:hypothetical protein BGS43_05055 [Campylobacter sp. 110]